MACRASYAKTFWRYKVNESKEGGPPCKCLATGLCFSLSAQGAPQFFEAMGGAAVFSPSRRPLFYSRKPKPSLAVILVARVISSASCNTTKLKIADRCLAATGVPTRFADPKLAEAFATEFKRLCTS